MPGNVTIEELPDHETRYVIADDRGDIVGRFGRRDVLHLRGLSWDSHRGADLVRLARDAIGLSIATEESQSKLHANGGKPGGILTTSESLGPEQLEQIRQAWQRRFAGSNNAFGTAVLDKGMDFKSLSMTGVDAQTLESRKHQVEEVCRFFNVFPQMVMQSDKTSTYASAEAFFGAHVRHTLAPWHELWKQTLDEFLLDGAGPLYADFDTRELTKASIADRESFYRTVTEMGIYTRNEIREMEGLEPIAGLDEPLTPRNMGTGSEGA
jgi:HK97 family phage portal protein